MRDEQVFVESQLEGRRGEPWLSREQCRDRRLVVQKKSCC